MSKAGYVYLPTNFPDGAVLSAMHVGVHRDTQVTFGHSIPQNQHNVLSKEADNRIIIHQVFTAAADLKGTNAGVKNEDYAKKWAQYILKAAYEGPLRAAVHLKAKKVFLTLVGGGVFGDKPEWIIAAINEMRQFIVNNSLDVTVVIYTGGEACRNELLEIVKGTEGTYTFYGNPPLEGLDERITVKSIGPDC